MDNVKCLSLRRYKDEVNEVKGGDECGLQLIDYSDFTEGDSIECYSILTTKQELM